MDLCCLEGVEHKGKIWGAVRVDDKLCMLTASVQQSWGILRIFDVLSNILLFFSTHKKLVVEYTNNKSTKKFSLFGCLICCHSLFPLSLGTRGQIPSGHMLNILWSQTILNHNVPSDQKSGTF